MTIPLPSLHYTVQDVPENLLQFPMNNNTDTNTSTSQSPASLSSTTNNTQEDSPPPETVLWIGCSDSLVSETSALTNVSRSSIFVHRNLGNRVSVGDVSSGSAIEWAVDVLKMILLITLITHFDIIQLHQESDALEPPAQSPQSRNRHFSELYVLSEMEWLRAQPSVQRAMKEWDCQVHAFVYDREQNRCVRLVPERSRK
ncbi:hypothetical protein NHQ30_008382 [Ciborinia camelliae]|nr:hypothetical protein NHQ30_008382 [Ciborinia camelliae]